MQLRTFFVIIIFLFVVLGGIFGVKTFILNTPQKNPSDIVQAFLEAYRQNDAERAGRYFMNAKQNEVSKTLKALKANNVIFDVKVAIDDVLEEDHVAQINARPILEPGDLAREVDFGGPLASWALYLSMVAQSDYDLQSLDFNRWRFFLVKNGTWWAGYHWEIVDAPEFFAMANVMRIINEGAKLIQDNEGAKSIQDVEDQKRKAGDARRVADIKQSQLALELYYDEYQTYPQNLAVLAPTYMPSVPNDPETRAPYFYAFSELDKTYHLGARLTDTTNPALKGDKDFYSRSTRFLNGFDGTDPVFDVMP